MSDIINTTIQLAIDTDSLNGVIAMEMLSDKNRVTRLFQIMTSSAVVAAVKKEPTIQEVDTLIDDLRSVIRPTITDLVQSSGDAPWLATALQCTNDDIDLTLPADNQG